MTQSNQTLVGAGKAAANQSRGSEAMVFSNPEFGTVRIQVDGNGEPWFCLVDICKALEIKSTTRAKVSLNAGGVHLMKVTTAQKNQYGESKKLHGAFFSFISEQNLYRLIMRSDKPQAKPFSVSCFTTSQIAKELGMTAQELNRLLCARHIQYYQSGQYMLYAEYAHMGLAKSRTHYDLFVGSDTIRTRMYLVWTERGRRFLHDNL